MENLARLLMVFGVILLILGGLIYLFAKLELPLDRIPLGNLPGDIRYSGKNITCLIPIATSIVISIILTIILNIIIRVLRH
jgi:hypothetical protein